LLGAHLVLSSVFPVLPMKTIDRKTEKRKENEKKNQINWV
jgi:hypothetical protein